VIQFGNAKLNMIGERISPGYKSVRAMIDTNDIKGIQDLAVKQAETGSTYLDVHLGTRGATDIAFVEQVVRGIQQVVSIPLCFDFAELKSLECCLRTYDRARAGGQLPLINSITEPRWELLELRKVAPFKVVVMASERLEDGAAKSNKSGEEIAATAKRCALRMVKENGMAIDDIFVDISVRALIADKEGMTRSTLEAVRLIHDDPALKGIHIMGAITNIGQQLPPKAADGSDLKLAIENAFMTVAVPSGLDTIMGTPWRAFQPLPEDNYVMTTFREFLQQSGSNALRSVRKFYRA
jgi:5-methyltetrahydrofolate--homocysteine methyltransferase